MNPPSFRTEAAAQRCALTDLCAERLWGHNLIIASNRGPVEFAPEGDGFRYRRGQGGLVTAISSMVEVTPTTWVAAAMSQADQAVARAHGGRVPVEVGGHPLSVSFLTPSGETYHQYYDLIANSVLWFLQHNMTNAPIHPTFDQALWAAWEEGYVAVNRLFADRLAEEAARGSRPPVFMIHDYHLYLVPGMLRARFPEAPIQHFTHIAWPSPDAWRQLPQAIRERLLNDMLGCDVVGFHCPRYAFNFLLTCQELLGARVDLEAGTVLVDGRVVRVRAYPISIDPDALTAIADTPEVLRAENRLLGELPPRMILQVARTDPSKNILRSFYAYEQFLNQYPEFIGQVQFLALLPSSRQSTELYKEYLEELHQVSDRINDDFGFPGWSPIRTHLENDFIRAVAAMKHYDVLVVNSIADGMNLVAKEGPILNRKDGVLVISEAAGAVEELGDGALVVNPFDLVGMAQAFHEALTMPQARRAEALAALRASIRRNTVFRWAHDQLRDLMPGTAAPRPGAVSLLPPTPAQGGAPLSAAREE